MDNEQISQLIESIDFNNLNNLLKIFEHHLLGYLNEIQTLAEIAINYTGQIPDEEEYHSRISKEQAIEIVGDFFKKIDLTYFNKFQDLINSGKGISFDGEGRSYCSIEKAVITLFGNVKDIYTLMHETVHKFISFRNPKSVLFILTESPSISLELALYDYLNSLSDDTNFKRDIKQFFHMRFYGAYKSAIRLLLECKLFDLYKKEGHINPKNLNDCFQFTQEKRNQSEMVSYEKFLEYLVNVSLGKGILSFHKGIKYVLAILVACDFRYKLKMDSNVVRNILEIGECLSPHKKKRGPDCIKMLSDLGVTFLGDISSNPRDSFDSIIGKNFIVVGEDLRKRYEMCLGETIEELFGIQVDDNLSSQGKRFYLRQKEN